MFTTLLHHSYRNVIICILLTSSTDRLYSIFLVNNGTCQSLSFLCKFTPTFLLYPHMLAILQASRLRYTVPRYLNPHSPLEEPWKSHISSSKSFMSSYFVQSSITQMSRISLTSLWSYRSGPGVRVYKLRIDRRLQFIKIWLKANMVGFQDMWSIQVACMYFVSCFFYVDYFCCSYWEN